MLCQTREGLVLAPAIDVIASLPYVTVADYPVEVFVVAAETEAAGICLELCWQGDERIHRPGQSIILALIPVAVASQGT